MLSNFFSALPTKTVNRVSELDYSVQKEGVNSEINDLLKRTVLLGGKRLRPLITQLFCDFFKVQTKNVETYSRSIEMVHAASLAHDDVIDNATMRRGKASINIESSNKMAILAGDYLLSNVIVELTKLGHLELVREMALVIEALSEGEWVQHNALIGKNYSREIIDEIAQKKTASVMSWCVLVGAYLSNSDEKILKLCREFGQKLGVSFQMIDDTLDFSSTEKDNNLDINNGLVNSVVYRWFENNPKMHEAYKNGADLDAVLKGESFEIEIKAIRTEASALLSRCHEILDEISETCETDLQVKKAIKHILKYLENRQK